MEQMVFVKEKGYQKLYILSKKINRVIDLYERNKNVSNTVSDFIELKRLSIGKVTPFVCSKKSTKRLVKLIFTFRILEHALK